MSEKPLPANKRSAIATPCVQVCKIDEASGLCSGCGRSRAEIARWASFDDAERQRIMALLPERLKASDLR